MKLNQQFSLTFYKAIDNIKCCDIILVGFRDQLIPNYTKGGEQNEENT